MAKEIIITLLLILWGGTAYAEGYSTRNGQQNHVYLMTSKTIYETSEDLWFKAFVFDSSTRELSDKDQTLYLEIRNSSDSVVWKEKYPLSEGMGEGQVYVGENWKPGEYFLSGYTRSSIGRGDLDLFPQHISVVNELRDFPRIAKKHDTDNVTYINADSLASRMKPGLRITMEMDSARFSPRSVIPMNVYVTDSIGKPVKAFLAISVSDALYQNPYIDNDIISYISGFDYSRRDKECGKEFLSDGVRGREIIGSRKMSKKTSLI